MQVGGALGAVIKFSDRFKKDYPQGVRARAKVFTFLGIVLFQLLQDIIFHLLNGKIFSPTKKATYNDINFGIASFMTCIEAVFFSILMHWSFSSSNYKEGAKMDRLNFGPAQRISTFRAVLNALNPSDIVAGTVIAMRMLFVKVASRYGSSRGSSGGKPAGTHLEPLAARRQGMRGSTDGSPERDEYETQYAAGYHAPPMPPHAVRDPSPMGRQGRDQMWRTDGLRPQYHGREGSYDYESTQAREMV